MARRDRMHAIAKILLDAAAYFMLGDEKETALYGATGVAMMRRWVRCCWLPVRM